MSWTMTCLLLSFFVAEEARVDRFGFFIPVVPAREIAVCQHRGSRGQAPENSRTAITMSIQDGFEWVEVDVRRTKDGKHVLSHDDRLGYVSPQPPIIRQLTWDSLKVIDSGTWFAPRFVRERLLPLEECLSISKNKINLYLDIKDADPAQLVEEIKAADITNQVIVYADLAFSDVVRQKSEGKIATMAKWRPGIDLERFVAMHGLKAVEIDMDDLSPEIVKRCHDQKVFIVAKVLKEYDRLDSWDRCMDLGIDAVQTDLGEEFLSRRFERKCSKRTTQIVHHRGANRYAPENTMPAFEKSFRMKADYVEFDVRTTKDGVRILLHDQRLDRTTESKGNINDKLFEQIQSLDAGNWFGLPFQNSRIPTLDIFLTALKGKSQGYLDLKHCEPTIIAADLKKFNMIDQVVIYGSPSDLKALKSIDRQFRTMPPLRDGRDIEPLARELAPYAFDVSWRLLTRELIEKCHAFGIKVFSDSLGRFDAVDECRKAIRMGIDVIQTDQPLRVQRAIELELKP